MSGTSDRARMWDRLASRYDRWIRPLELVWFTGGRVWVCARAVGRVLDVATGTGRNFSHLPADAMITGVDLSPGMLDVAHRRAIALGRRVVLCEGDATALPFDDSAFDSVVCTLGLCEISDPAIAISEMGRVLRPGGRLLLLDHVGSTWRVVLAAQSLVERATTGRTGEHLTRRSLPLVAAAGFDVLETRRSRIGTVEAICARRPATMD